MARRRITWLPNSVNEEGTGHIPLDRVRILETALWLLDEIGLKELSMRKIADKLGVKTASLYYHVKDKEELMQMLSDRISGEMVWPEISLSWQEQIYQWAGQFRRVLLSHRDTVELFRQTIAMGYERLTQIEKLFQLLVSAGFSDSHVPWIASMLKNYVLGFVAEEDQLQAIAKNHYSSYDEMGNQYDQFYRQLPEERFPNMIRLASYTTKTNWENEFYFGLSVLIDGFSVKLTEGNEKKSMRPT
ncbi:TetR/AcrR family transcriptional regulator C-terminal domain-containing protein [Paenibacillus sp. P96]|uniref:TetR/AcrR family transcriptional regulator C-terminal domain-containing protein n=1 Tax=Paenibacillus zeirhizosphaerae TaxID=2987519 RepID=A0ABT9FNX8_9BACL|nr:TetR/AcrR family transcriptional regulator C-terminal domain-containing protein [Paenibacillus sp. P96]MDP4096206.1 TetR/AcrR family transcriptional regulator C-terminal domain-containing protein [Paenibacillus sp. P96]